MSPPRHNTHNPLHNTCTSCPEDAACLAGTHWVGWMPAHSQLERKISQRINPLAPGKFDWNFRYVIFKRISVIDGCGKSCEIDLWWMPLDLTDEQSTLVQVMAWCCQATSHYLSQCWPRFLSPYDVTRPQWVNPQVKDDRCSRYPLERGTYLIRGMGPHVSKVSLKYLFTEISKDSSEISISGIIHYIIR